MLDSELCDTIYYCFIFSKYSIIFVPMLQVLQICYRLLSALEFSLNFSKTVQNIKKLGILMNSLPWIQCQNNMQVKIFYEFEQKGMNKRWNLQKFKLLFKSCDQWIFFSNRKMCLNSVTNLIIFVLFNPLFLSRIVLKYFIDYWIDYLYIVKYYYFSKQSDFMWLIFKIWISFIFTNLF